MNQRAVRGSGFIVRLTHGRERSCTKTPGTTSRLAAKAGRSRTRPAAWSGLVEEDVGGGYGSTCRAGTGLDRDDDSGDGPGQRNDGIMQTREERKGELKRLAATPNGVNKLYAILTRNFIPFEKLPIGTLMIEAILDREYPGKRVT